MSAATPPTLRVEKQLLRAGHRRVLCIDEVGLGALGGPVTVGVVVVDASVTRPLTGVRDSKLLSAAARAGLVDKIVSWAAGSSVGHASAGEIDAHGITVALRMAARRALAALSEPDSGSGVGQGGPGDVILLDGNRDWFTAPAQRSLFDDGPSLDLAAGSSDVDGQQDEPSVTTLVRADRCCSGVAAASVLAKVRRDALMVELAEKYPIYDWDTNKGYGTATHMVALRRHGPCAEHRTSWRLPGTENDGTNRSRRS